MGTGSKIFSECRGSARRGEPRQVQTSPTEVLSGGGGVMRLPWLHRQPGLVSVFWEERWVCLV